MYKKNNYNISFKNKTVIITGGTRGIGKQVVKDFKKLGANVLSISTKNFDLSNKDEIKKLLLLISKYKKVDVLINNAGINYSALNVNFSLNKFNKLIDVNIKSLFLLTQAVSKKMIKNKSGKIINIGSIAADRVRAGRSAYSVSKFGVIGFTKTISIELAKYNILVNSVSPGFIDTEMTRTMLTKKEIKKLTDQVPLRRLGSTQDISNSIIFLCSDLNSFITGHNLVVDGGFLGAVNV
jgi:3-oxoacyl-[acyl-carrier protein] reductase